MEQQSITRDLEYRFTNEEKLEMGKQLAAENQNKRKLEDSKKAVMSQYGSQINEKQEVINQLTDKLAAGCEYRKTECTVEWHTPERNKKTITRTDTGESWVERMTEYDHDLFNQFEEQQAAAAAAEEEDFENGKANTDEEPLPEEGTDSEEPAAPGGEDEWPEEKQSA